MASRSRRVFEPLRAGWWLMLLAVAIVPTVAAVYVRNAESEYGARATLSFTGNNTGTVLGDVDQARRAARRDRTMADRALNVTGITDVQPAELQDAVHFHHTGDRTQLEVAVHHPDDEHVAILCTEFARQLARDQYARVVSNRCEPSRISPRPWQAALLGIAVALPLGVAFALGREALRSRRSNSA